MASFIDTSDEHKRRIIGARRRNNIYGEVGDFILTAFLAAGGDGAIYNNSECDEVPITFIGRTRTMSYIVKVFYHSPGGTAAVDEATRVKLIQLAESLKAVPIYAIAREHPKHVRFYNAQTKSKLNTLL